MMMPVLITFIWLLLMIIYVLVKKLKKAEGDIAYIINELGQKNAFDSEQEQRECQHSTLERLVSLPHSGVERQLFVVSTLVQRCVQRGDDTASRGELSDLLGLQCFLLDVMDFTATPVNNPATHCIRQQIKDLCRTYDPVQREEP